MLPVSTDTSTPQDQQTCRRSCARTLCCPFPLSARRAAELDELLLTPQMRISTWGRRAAKCDTWRSAHRHRTDAASPAHRCQRRRSTRSRPPLHRCSAARGWGWRSGSVEFETGPGDRPAVVQPGLDQGLARPGLWRRCRSLHVQPGLDQGSLRRSSRLRASLFSLGHAACFAGKPVAGTAAAFRAVAATAASRAAASRAATSRARCDISSVASDLEPRTAGV